MKFWEEIEEIIHYKPKTGQVVSSLGLNGSFSTSQNQITNFFNTFFCNIPKEMLLAVFLVI